MTPLRIITALVTSSTPAGGFAKDLNSTIALTERQSTASSAAFKAGAAASSYLFNFSVASSLVDSPLSGREMVSTSCLAILGLAVLVLVILGSAVFVLAIFCSRASFLAIFGLMIARALWYSSMAFTHAQSAPATTDFYIMI